MIQSAAARLAELGEESDLPFVAWANYLALASTTLSTNLALLPDGALANAVSGTTFDYWLPDISAANVVYVADIGVGTRPTFAAIVGHNIGTLGASVQVQRSANGIAWFDAGVGVVTPTDDSPIGFRMTDNASNTARYWRFYVTGLTVGDPLYVAGLFMGREAIFPVGIYDGFAPPIYPNDVQLQSNVSVGGNFLGSSVIAQGSQLPANMAYMRPDFVRTDLADFIPSFNRGKPFWFAWRPFTFPTDLRYCWREGDPIRPANSGGLDFMAFTMAMRAYEP